MGEMNKMEEMGIGMEKMKRLNNYRQASPGCSIVLRAPCCSSDYEASTHAIARVCLFTRLSMPRYWSPLRESFADVAAKPTPSRIIIFKCA